MGAMENRPSLANTGTAILTAIAASDDAGTPPSAIRILPLGEIAARAARRWRIPATRLQAEEKARGIAITHAEAVVRLRPMQN